MGLQYNVQILCGSHSVVGFSGGFLREHYGALAIITGMPPEKVAEECWSQLVSTEMAATFLRHFGEPGHYEDFGGHYGGEAALVRITIA